MRYENTVLEIQTEELPARLLPVIEQEWPRIWTDLFAESGVQHGAIVCYTTPRRLALHVTQLAEYTRPAAVERKGPPVNVSLNEAGEILRPLAGFLRQHGAQFSDLCTKDTPKGAYFYYWHTPPACAVQALFPDWITRALSALTPDKVMRWGSCFPFSRPVRGIWLQYGSHTWPCALPGIAANVAPQGHPVHAPGPVMVAHADAYLSAMQAACVSVDPAVRRRKVTQAIEQLATEVGGHIHPDPALLTEITGITEWPHPIRGSFDSRFLALPQPLVLAVLIQHQRYFPVWDQPAATQARLLPFFVAVANIESANPEKMRRGFERVLLARLNDAWYFYTRDQEQSLADRVGELTGVMQHQSVGTLWDQTCRINRWMARLRPGSSAYTAAQREMATRLLWADLRTQVVQEFPELHGIIGACYTEKSDPVVAQALRESILPRGGEGPLPESPLGCDLALAERLDTLVGLFAVAKPTGNRDPFALRRNALGIVRILIDHPQYGPLPTLLEWALSAHEPVVSSTCVLPDVAEFCWERFKSWVSSQYGLRSDQWQAVRHTPPVPAERLRRMQALAELSGHENWSELLALYKRVERIVLPVCADIPCQLPDPPLEPSEDFSEWERVLWETAAACQQQAETALQRSDYVTGLLAFWPLHECLGNFLAHVLVHAPDPVVRRRRLMGLHAIYRGMHGIADLSPFYGE